MKKLFILAIGLLSITELFSIPILKYHRYKRCGIIGCGSVDYEKELTTFNNGAGGTKDGWSVEIHCTGSGFNHCPRTIGPSGYDIQETNIENCSEINSCTTYATEQILANNLQGSQTLAFTQPDGSTKQYIVVWSLNEDGEETISVNEVI